MSKSTEDTDTTSITPVEELFDLHRQLARSLLIKMRDGTATAADRSVATSFLRLNGVFRGGALSPSEVGEAVEDLYRSLPKFDDDLDMATAVANTLN